MPDIAKILRLVEEGALSAEEADDILAKLGTPADTAGSPPPAASKAADHDTEKSARHLRVEITEGGKRVVNLRVPVNIASFAAGFVPGLPEETAERVRSSIRAGLRGPIVDIDTGDGDRVLIVNE
jgi:hypothetical protein